MNFKPQPVFCAALLTNAAKPYKIIKISNDLIRDDTGSEILGFDLKQACWNSGCFIISL